MNWKLVLICAALPMAAFAQMYKWKDERGQVHFTQTPPKTGVPFELLGAPPPPSDTPDNQASLNKALDDARKAAPEQQKTAEAAEQQQLAKQQACARAIERLAYLDARTPRRLATTDAQGNVKRMDDDEFQRQRAAEQKKMDENCG